MRAALITGAAALLLAACGGGAEEPEGLDAASSAPSPSETTTDDAPVDEAAILSVYDRYWEAVVASENGPSRDPGLFKGVAGPHVIQTQLAAVGGLIGDGLHRYGEPKLSDPVITPVGNAGAVRVEVCVDNSTWGAALDDVTPSPKPTKPRPNAVTMEIVDGSWLVTKQLGSNGATIKC